MKSKKCSMMLVLSLIGMVTGSFGCAFNRVNLVDAGVVTLERVDPEKNCIARPHVYQDGSELIIHGSVKCHRFRGFSRGHIDIAIVSAEGEVLQSLSTFYYPRNIPRKGDRESRFHVNLSLTPRKGTVVRLAFHKVETPSMGRFFCGDNVAIPDGQRENFHRLSHPSQNTIKGPVTQTPR